MPGQAEPERVVIMGAAGRDFHDFNTCFRDDPRVRVIAFTAAQIPDIADRRYPPSLAGGLYPEGIPILPEETLTDLIARERIDRVLFSYSDLSHVEVMHRASLVLAAGAGFGMLAPKETMLASSVPVVSVCAVRTGVGKSAVSRHILGWLGERGLRVAAVRHPMPYGDLEEQAVQHFESTADLDRAKVTLEEREEYEPYLAMGAGVFAGVDYARILERAQQDRDVILWDGGNNDLPFFHPDLHIVLLDAHRPGHEQAFHPGEANFRSADVIIINKVDSAPPAHVEALTALATSLRPDAPIVLGEMALTMHDPDAIRGARVVIVGDGPTLTHGGLASGAGTVAARQHGVSEIVSAGPFAVGSLAEAFDSYDHLGPEVPALGYSPNQIRDLEATLEATPADVVIDATPASLAARIQISKPIVTVDYGFRERTSLLDDILSGFCDRFSGAHVREPRAAK